MCRLFGFRSSVKSTAHHSLIVAENAVAHQANYHSDGWGIGYFVDKEAYLFRSSEGAATDPRFRTFSERLSSNTLLVHLRRATVGKVDTINSHPFRHAAWMFAHNGTIFGFNGKTLDDKEIIPLKELMKEHILPELQDLIFGTTDSEHYFYFLLSSMVNAGACSIDGRGPIDIDLAAQAQNTALSHIFTWCQSYDIDPPKANYILTNGEVFFARRAGLELYASTQKNFCKDALTCAEPDKICLKGFLPRLQKIGQTRKCNHIIIASEPIGQENIGEEIPDGALLSLSSDFVIKVHTPPRPFWVTWPDVVTRHRKRCEVVPAPDDWALSIG